MVIENVYNEEASTRIGYGIALFENNSSLISSFPDVSRDRKAVEKLVNLCNKLDLSPDHLTDVIEDFLVCSLT